MTSAPERVRVVCPNCQGEYEDWYRPSINFDLDDFDPEYLEECSTAICPTCQFKVWFEQLVIRNGVFCRANIDRFATTEPPTRYFTISDGVALLRRIETPSTLRFDVLNRSGEWQNGVHLGVGIMSGNVMDFDEITPSTAKELAAELGGALVELN